MSAAAARREADNDILGTGPKLLHALCAHPRSTDGYAGAVYLTGILERQNKLLAAILKTLNSRRTL